MKYFISKVGVVLLFAMTSAVAAPPKSWNSTGVAIECKSQNIQDVFKNLSALYDIEIISDDSVTGECYGWLKHSSIIKFLDSVSATYGLSWYYLKNKLYISKKNEFEITRIDISAELHGALKKLKLIEPKYGWSLLKDTEQVLVNGPSSYLAYLKEIVESENKKKDAKKKSSPVISKSNNNKTNQDNDVFIIPVQHASVVDRKIEIRGSSLLIPGIATVLGRIISGGGNTGSSENTDPNGLLSFKNGGETQIEADTRTNSIVIRSSEKPESYFQTIISGLDKPLELVEIDAMIIDVNRETFYEIGMRYGIGSNQNSDSLLLDGLDNMTSNLSAVLNIGNYAEFFADLRMLEGRGEANIVANTSILTIENQPALIDLSNTFYIRTTGEGVANVTPVTTGTLLNITPQLLTDGEELMVQLIVNVEDGKILDQVVDDIPIVSRSTVSTKAIIEAGKSLVIGGYRLQSSENSRKSIPLLGQIPFLKELFTYKTTSTQNKERLFVITPRISSNSHEPIKKIRSDIHSYVKEDVKRLLSTDTEKYYSASRVEKAASMFQEILESSEIATTYTASMYANSGAPFSCYAPGLAFEFFGLPSFMSDGVTVYKIKVINKTTSRKGIAESSCSGQGLIAAVNFGSRTLNVGESSFLLAAFDSVLIKN